MYKKFTIALITGSLIAPVGARAQEEPAGASVSAGVLDAEMEADKLAFFREHIKELQGESRPYANPVRRGEVLPPEYTLHVIPPIFGRRLTSATQCSTTMWFLLTRVHV